MVTTSGGFAYKRRSFQRINRTVTSTTAAAAAATSWRTRIAVETATCAVTESCAVFVISVAAVNTVFGDFHHTVLMMTTSTFVR